MSSLRSHDWVYSGFGGHVVLEHVCRHFTKNATYAMHTYLREAEIKEILMQKKLSKSHDSLKASNLKVYKELMYS